MEPLTLQTMLAFFQPPELREVLQSPLYSDVMINPNGSVFVDEGAWFVRQIFMLDRSG